MARLAPDAPDAPDEKFTTPPFLPRLARRYDTVEIQQVEPA
jgi:hypothetical protein